MSSSSWSLDANLKGFGGKKTNRALPLDPLLAKGLVINYREGGGLQNAIPLKTG